MPPVTANGLQLCYEVDGEHAASPSCSSTATAPSSSRWHDELVGGLVERGFRADPLRQP